MKMMTPTEGLPELSNLAYPCYVQPILNGLRAIYHPETGLTVDASLIKLNDICKRSPYVLDGEIVKDKYIVYDCFLASEWDTKNGTTSYEYRLKRLRSVIYGDIAETRYCIDVANHETQNPLELLELYKMYLKKGYEGVIIRAVDSAYYWEEAPKWSNAMWQLKPTKKKND